MISSRSTVTVGSPMNQSRAAVRSARPRRRRPAGRSACCQPPGRPKPRPPRPPGPWPRGPVSARSPAAVAALGAACFRVLCALSCCTPYVLAILHHYTATERSKPRRYSRPERWPAREVSGGFPREWWAIPHHSSRTHHSSRRAGRAGKSGAGRERASASEDGEPDGDVLAQRGDQRAGVEDLVEPEHAGERVRAA